MGTLVSYQPDEAIAVIAMDDGKVNALSLEMLGQVNAALDRAQRESVIVVLTGREGVFSAGFDLGVLRAGSPDAPAMVRAGFDLAERLLSFPTPVVVACSGHAVAMGAFLLLSGDYRIGAAGPYRITANEVALGLTMPRAAVEICRQRLVPAHFTRALLLAEVYSPDGAVAAGFLDRTVEGHELAGDARSVAVELVKLDLAAHAASKARARAGALALIHAAIEADAGALRMTA